MLSNEILQRNPRSKKEKRKTLLAEVAVEGLEPCLGNVPLVPTTEEPLVLCRWWYGKLN